MSREQQYQPLHALAEACEALGDGPQSSTSIAEACGRVSGVTPSIDSVRRRMRDLRESGVLVWRRAGREIRLRRTQGALGRAVSAYRVTSRKQGATMEPHILAALVSELVRSGSGRYDRRRLVERLPPNQVGAVHRVEALSWGLTRLYVTHGIRSVLDVRAGEWSIRVPDDLACDDEPETQRSGLTPGWRRRPYIVDRRIRYDGRALCARY